MSNKIRVGLQLSTGGLGDKSFNDSAYAGLEAAHQKYDFEFEAALWHNMEESLVAIENWAKTDYDLIIAIGYRNAALINQVAAAYPDKRFAIVDFAGQGPNVWSATYREYEGDFVMGALAAMVSQTRIIGFMGGGETPVVRRIELGFAQGVEYIDPGDITLISDYIGDFDDPFKGQVLAETQYSLGADVIYQVAGRCGLGAIAAAKEFDKWIISTGSDHSSLAPKSVLTSRIKDVGKPVQDIIQAVTEDRFAGGLVKSYGFAEGGLMIAPIRPTVSEIVTPRFQTLMQEIKDDVVSGVIEVNLDD